MLFTFYSFTKSQQSPTSHPKRHNTFLNMQALNQVAMFNNDSSYGDIDPSLSIFNSDTRTVCPDNCTTQHICNDPSLTKDLVDIPMSSVGGLAVPKQIGTMVLNIKDDDGVTHVEEFLDTYLMPQSPKILISPIQWAEQINDEDEEGTSIQSFHTYS